MASSSGGGVTTSSSIGWMTTSGDATATPSQRKRTSEITGDVMMSSSTDGKTTRGDARATAEPGQQKRKWETDADDRP